MKTATLFVKSFIFLILMGIAPAMASGESVGLFFSTTIPQHEFAANDIKKILELKNFKVEVKNLSELTGNYEGKKVDNSFAISFKVKNIGSSPFYYNWPGEVSLLHRGTKQPVWKEEITDIDIRTWMPGDKWDNTANANTIPAEAYTVNEIFEITKIPSGEYIVALAILDPAGNQPSARFAIENYYNGGRHPVGKVGVDKAFESYSVSGFDDIRSDKSLHYLINNNLKQGIKGIFL